MTRESYRQSLQEVSFHSGFQTQMMNALLKELRDEKPKSPLKVTYLIVGLLLVSFLGIFILPKKRKKA